MSRLRIKAVAYAAFALIAFAPGVASAQNYQFRPSSIVVADGDSITENFLGQGYYYQPFLNAINATYFKAGVTVATARSAVATSNASVATGPGLALQDTRPVVTNLGVAGWRITDLLARQPSWVGTNYTDIWLEVGVNDLGVTAIGTFRSSYDAYLDAAIAAHPSVHIIASGILCLSEQVPSPNGYDPLIIQYNAQISASVASHSANVTYVDVRTPQQAYEIAHNLPAPGTISGVLCADAGGNNGVHPNPTGIALWSTTMQGVTTFTGTPQ